MKIIRIFVLLLIGCSGVQSSRAQEPESDSLLIQASLEYPLKYAGVLKTNPLSMLWGSIPLTAEYMVIYEFVSSPQQASQVGLSYISKSPILKAFEDTVPDLKLLTASGVRIQISHRLYVLTRYDFAPRGLYVAPQFSYATVKISTKHYSSRDVYIRITHFNANILIGWQWIFGGKFTLDVFGGFGYKENIWEQHDSQTTISLDLEDQGDWYAGPYKVSFGVHMGIAF